MATSTLNNKVVEANDDKASIIIVNAVGDIPGGRTLDVSGVADGTTIIPAGTVLVINDETKEVAPLGVSDGAYDALPDGCSYLGILKSSVSVTDARAAILTMGQVNQAACPYEITDDIKAGLPNIQFLY